MVETAGPAVESIPQRFNALSGILGLILGRVAYDTRSRLELGRLLGANCDDDAYSR